MAETREAVAALVEEKPDLEGKLRQVVEIDAESDGWTFDDVPLDAGEFGEVVSRDVAVEGDSGYELADPGAVRAALDGDGAAATDPGASRSSLPSFASVDRRWALALVGALAVVVLVRVVFVYGSVFRNGDVVLVSNDPYYYRYNLEALVTSDRSPFSPSDLDGFQVGTTILAGHDVLFIYTTWLAATLLGGTTAAVSAVLAWYPVVAGVVTALAVYLISARITGDRRVALASVLLLAVIPAHAYRTMVGMGDHHAFDYVWLSLTVLGLVSLLDIGAEGRPTEREYWRDSGRAAWTALTGVGLAAQALAWRAGPALFVPFAVFVAVSTLASVRERESPLVANAPLAAAAAVASVLTLVPYLTLGWARLFRAVSPPLLCCGIAATTLVGELAVRRERTVAETTVASLVVGVGLLAAAWVAIPDVADAILHFVSYQTEKLDSQIADSTSLLSPRRGLFVAPLLEVGVPIYLSLPVAGWATWVGFRDHRRGWVALGTYYFAFLALSLNQIRFTAHLSLFVATFGAVGFLALADWVDLLEAPALFAEGRSAREVASDGRALLPSGADLVSLSLLLLLVTGVGIVQTPVKQSQLTIDEGRYEAATWIEEYSDDNGLTYPDNYVFSSWGRNRVYNYFVNGQSKSYSFAANYFEQFLLSENPDKWDGIMAYHPIGFVVTEDQPADLPERSMYDRLHEHWGTADYHAPGLGRYRAVHATDDGDIKVFEVVPGPTVRWRLPSNESVAVTRTEPVSVGGTSFTYERVVRPDNGTYEVNLPYPGTYEIGDATLRVNETFVREGGFTSVNVTASE
ncbi:STT3 domain-containing protein [Halosimplex marinum]|uniref:STT3 domain-containing protein n=1 Tax=Halosimplex marinum TaxID=3396620 RepID=UPI003F550228